MQLRELAFVNSRLKVVLKVRLGADVLRRERLPRNLSFLGTTGIALGLKPGRILQSPVRAKAQVGLKPLVGTLALLAVLAGFREMRETPPMLHGTLE